MTNLYKWCHNLLPKVAARHAQLHDRVLKELWHSCSGMPLQRSLSIDLSPPVSHCVTFCYCPAVRGREAIQSGEHRVAIALLEPALSLAEELPDNGTDLSKRSALKEVRVLFTCGVSETPVVSAASFSWPMQTLQNLSVAQCSMNQYGQLVNICQKLLEVDPAYVLFCPLFTASCP